jgi:tetratricopeptide (TPR) repeat protein
VRTPARRSLGASLLATALSTAVAAAAAAAPFPPEGGKPGAAPAAPTVYKEQSKDEILLKGARAPMTGVEILVDAYDKVEWKSKSGPPQHRDRAEIAWVKLADEPGVYTKGLEYYRAGAWEDADNQLRGVRSAIEAGKARAFGEARAQAYLGDCRRRAAAGTVATGPNDSKYKDAASVLQESLKLDPKSPIVDMVYLSLAEAQAGTKDWDAALKTLDDLKKVGSDAARPLWEGRARLARGRMLERKGEVGGAAGEYAELAKFADQAAGKLPPDTPDRRELDAMKVNGLVSQGWALYGRAEKTKNPADVDAARKHFEGLPAATAGSLVGKAASVNGLGGILLLDGKYQKAVEKFVEVEVTMFGATDEVARALWFKAQAYDRLGNGAGREQALKDLSEFYPLSEWAVRAR